MQTSSHVRKHLTPEQRRKVLADYEQSDLTQKQFAAQRGIALSTLYAWRKKARGEPQGGSSQFVEAPNLFSVPAGPHCYRLRVPGGLELEISHGFRSEEVAELLRLLQEL
jgi:hypothetical protein